MFSSPIDIYFLLSGLYPITSIVYVLKNKHIYNSEIFELDGPAQTIDLHVKNTHTQMPVYVNMQHAHIPIGGGTYTNWDRIISLQLINNERYINYTPQLNSLFPYNNISYINSLEKANELLKNYHIEDKVPITIPLKVCQTTIPGPKLYLHQSTGLIDNNRERILRFIMWQRRLYGTLTIPIVSAIVGIGYWALP